MTSDAQRQTVGIVVAGGTGERFGRRGGKQLLEVAGRPVLARSAEAVARANAITQLVIVCDPDRVDDYRAAVGEAGSIVPTTFVAGGSTRQQSVERGLTAAERLGASTVVVHDGARPLVPSALIDRACDALWANDDFDGVIVGYPVTDTLKVATGQVVGSTPDRSQFWAVQTPQVFRAAALRGALDSARSAGFVGTDDASVVERNGGVIGLVVGPRDNLKITVAEDAAMAEAVLAWRAGE